jgi:ubiquinone biosynthesis protein
VACRLASEERGAVWLRRYLQRAGGTFVKLGQLMASRSDLLGATYQRELAKLSDRMPSTPFGVVNRIIEDELHRPLGEVFSSFERVPVASASIAQVHRATLPGGELVAVKVGHPDMGRRFAVDLFLLNALAKIAISLGFFSSVDIEDLLSEVNRLLRREFDFVFEALNAHRMHTLMAEDQVKHVAPKVFFSHSARHVLTMEFFEGVWLNEVMASVSMGDIAELSKLEEMTGTTPKQIARVIFRSLIEQISTHRTVHADPHGGNIVVRLDGSIGFVDFGNVGVLDERSWQQQTALFRGLAERNIHKSYLALLSMVEPVPLVRRNRLEREVKGHIADWLLAVTTPEAPIGMKSNGRLLLNCVNSFRSARLPIPWIFISVMRATLISDMYIYTLDPTFDPVREMLDYFENVRRDEERRLLTDDPVRELENYALTALAGVAAIRTLSEWLINELPLYGRIYTDAISRSEQVWARILGYASRVGVLLVIAILLVKTGLSLQLFSHNPLVQALSSLGWLETSAIAIVSIVLGHLRHILGGAPRTQR